MRWKERDLDKALFDAGSHSYVDKALFGYEHDIKPRLGSLPIELPVKKKISIYAVYQSYVLDGNGDEDPVRANYFFANMKMIVKVSNAIVESYCSFHNSAALDTMVFAESISMLTIDLLHQLPIDQKQTEYLNRFRKSSTDVDNE